jgi:hypothetical protein
MRSGFAEFYAELWHTRQKAFRPSLHYQLTADMRDFGYDVILHHGLKHGKKGDGKLEVIDAGTKSRRMIEFEVESIYDVDPRKLDVMRADLCADVPGVTVPWFHSRIRAKYKRWGAKFREHGLEMSEMGMNTLQTIYMGKRPNAIRVYDKFAECMYQYQRLSRNKKPKGDADLIMQLEEKMPSYGCWRFSVDAIEGTHEAAFNQFDLERIRAKRHCYGLGAPEPEPQGVIKSFEETFAHVLKGHTVLTRVERQIGGGRIPEQISSLGRFGNLPEFNPFDLIEIAQAGKPVPVFSGSGLGDFKHWCAGMYLRELYEAQGRPFTEKFLKNSLGTNYHRDVKQFAEFLPYDLEIDAENKGITSRGLYEIYRNSVERQLAA